MFISENKWLKRIFSIEFAALCVAIIAVYLAYIPVKNYFFDDNSIVGVFNGQQINFSNDEEKSDTIKLIAYTFHSKSFSVSHLVTLKNISNHIIKGLNVKSEYICENITGMISDDWKYNERGWSGSCSYSRTELSAFGEITSPFADIGLLNFDEPWHTIIMTTTLAYEGCKKEKRLSLLIHIKDIDVSDIYYNRYGNGTVDENRVGFNNDFIKKCVITTYNHYYRDSPQFFYHWYVYMNTFDAPVLLSMDEVINMYKGMK